MKFKFIFIFLISLLIISPIEAAKIDTYKNTLISGNFTIKYEVDTPPLFSASKSGLLNDYKLHDVSNNFNYKYSGIIVKNGNDRYIEIKSNLNKGWSLMPISKEYSYCTLIKNGEIFNFTYTDEGKYFGYRNNYYLHHSNKIEAGKIEKANPYKLMMSEYNYDDVKFSQALSAMLPPDRIIATSNTPNYQFAGSGNLGNNLSYEDFTSDKNEIFSAIRYYFNGNSLVKIAMASYVKSGNSIQSYEKYIFNITEFSNTPDKKYLSLPEKLKELS